MGGLREGLRDSLQLAVKKGAREIGAGFDVGRIGAAAECNRHLLRCFKEGVAYDFKLYRIEFYF